MIPSRTFWRLSQKSLPRFYQPYRGSLTHPVLTDQVLDIPESFSDRRITESYYNKKRDEYRSKQTELQKKMGKLQIADEEYYITSDYVLNLASRADELFESSEPIEKRQLIKFALQNLVLDGSLVRYDEIKPFDTIREYASRQAWLARWDDFRTTNWVTEIEFPKLILQQTQDLLAIV